MNNPNDVEESFNVNIYIYICSEVSYCFKTYTLFDESFVFDFWAKIFMICHCFEKPQAILI